MATSNVKASFSCDIQKVWDIVTSLENYSWRSDLSRVEVISENRFIEYAKGGCATTFTVTAVETCRRWEFDMENENMKGHWTGTFSQTDGMSTVAFTENIDVKKLLMKPFVKAYLKKQQAAYLADLRKALPCGRVLEK